MLKVDKPEFEREVGFSDKLDVLKHVTDIRLRLKKDITNDFVLAKLGEQDKLGIIEMTTNAYFSKKLLDIIIEKQNKWIFNGKEYEKVKLSDEEINIIKKIANRIFDTYMIKINMTVVLNRNIDQNYLINVLSGYRDDEEKEVSDEDINAVKELLKDKTQSEK